MREADRLTIAGGVPGLILMETAAAAVVERVLVVAEPEARIVVLAGKGNNGGDGLAAARQLAVRRPGLAITTILTADPESLQGDARANLEMLRAVVGEPIVVQDETAWEATRGALDGAAVVVDALLGTGLSGPARGLPAKIIADVNARAARATVIAVDLPSGLQADRASVEGEIVQADETVTFTAPKPAQVLLPSAELCGRLHVTAIGTTEALVEDLPGDRLYLAEAADAAPFVAKRNSESHKGTYGHVAAVGGSASTPGAILMTGAAALRSGAGLATVFTARNAAPAVVAGCPELMTAPVDELPDGSIGPDSLDLARLNDKTALVVGPGLGATAENTALVGRLLDEVDVPTVVDADGLRAFPRRHAKPRTQPVVLTPHPGEMARIAGISIADVQADRIGVARTWAERMGVVLVLKGARTLVAAPDGRVVVNPTGTPGMATAGSGDVLAGLLAGLLAQFPQEAPQAVAAAAVFLHGLAGEHAARKLGEQAMLATDILKFLPEAARDIHGQSDV